LFHVLRVFISEVSVNIEPYFPHTLYSLVVTCQTAPVDSVCSPTT